MASLYEVIEGIKGLFSSTGITVYDIDEFDDKSISRLSDDKFPVICIGRQLEEIDNDASPTDCIVQSAIIDINFILNTGKENLRDDCYDWLRYIKTVIYTNRNSQIWDDLVMVDNFIAQLANSNDNSKVYGGLNINCSVNYRERIDTQIIPPDQLFITGDKSQVLEEDLKIGG